MYEILVFANINILYYRIHRKVVFSHHHLSTVHYKNMNKCEYEC
jgi:hypothetical protein